MTCSQIVLKVYLMEAAGNSETMTVFGPEAVFTLESSFYFYASSLMSLNLRSL